MLYRTRSGKPDNPDQNSKTTTEGEKGKDNVGNCWHAALRALGCLRAISAKGALDWGSTKKRENEI